MENSNYNSLQQPTSQDENRRLLIIGCGGVCKCSLSILTKLLVGNLTIRSITVMDPIEPSSDTLAWLKKNKIVFVKEKVEKKTYGELLGQYLHDGDLLYEVANGVSTVDLLRWCQDHNVSLINTNLDYWWDLPSKTGNQMEPFAVYDCYREFVEMKQTTTTIHDSRTLRTTIVGHGANPGIVSHFAKRGLEDMARYVLSECASSLSEAPERRKEIEHTLALKQHARLAQALGIKVIHIAERDTQITSKPKQVNEFVNTWSVEGILEEAAAYVEFAWGTHERKKPLSAILYGGTSDNHQSDEATTPDRICFPTLASKFLIRSWVPSGRTLGMAFRHPEAYSIADHLTVFSKNNKEISYRPTVVFSYLPSDSTMNSLHEWIMNDFPEVITKRVLFDEITEGADELGILLLGGYDVPAWWTGSVLDIHSARRMVPGQNATTVQVAVAGVAAIIYCMKYPEKGILMPEHVDTDEILNITMPYLGQWVSKPVDWQSSMPSWKNVPDIEPDPWQFESFYTMPKPIASMESNTSNSFVRLNVAIIGCGIGGLAAAIALQRHGHQVTVYERAHFASEIGASISVAANGTRFLEEWGVDTVAGRSVILQKLIMRNWSDGKINDVYDLSDYKEKWGYVYNMFHRVDLHEQLQITLKALGATIVVDHKAIDVDVVKGIVTFDTGTKIHADLIIGADGVRSNIRSLIGINAKTKPSTSACYRCVIPTSRVKQLGLIDYAPNSAIEFWGGFTVSKIVLSPCCAGEIISFYCFYPAEHNDRSEEGWNFTATSSMLRAPFPDLDPALLAIFEHVEDIKLWKLVVHEPYPYWVKGCVALLGDAAHPMLPDQSQGACMAIEDAAALGLIFSPDYWGKTIQTIDQGLKLYEQLRKPRATRVQEASARARENLNERIGWSSQRDTGIQQQKTTKLTIDEINGYDMKEHLKTLLN